MTLRLIAFSLCAIASLGVNAADSYSVAWDAPEFTTVTGFFTLPKLPISDGGSFVGPGLHTSNGVLQVVLDSRYNQLWLGNDPLAPQGLHQSILIVPTGPEFRGTPGIPWGPGFNVSAGEDMKFLFNNTGAGRWVVEVGWATGGGAHGVFDLGDSVLNSAVLTAELNDIPFDFGPINYCNVTLTATTPASEWCDKIRQVGDYVS
ncbi:hypothetical protein AAF712_005507 [Marasmius tenuissimus]|uniref:Uncharacterized protein n=1 Tax=Marasmius tenuissimus TaxID=585030 RepID=A0ABR3A2D3_9AGAR